jgi:hypothetical protein
MARQNGRTPPVEKLYDFLFQDTGRQVQIRKVSSLLRAEIRRQVIASPGFEEPRPPLSTVDYGDGNVQIPNPAHPLYQELRKEWLRRVTEETGQRLKTIAIRRGVVCEVDAAAVAAARADAAQDGIDLTLYDDHEVYVAFICVGSDDDYTDLLRGGGDPGAYRRLSSRRTRAVTSLARRSTRPRARCASRLSTSCSGRRAGGGSRGTSLMRWTAISRR